LLIQRGKKQETIAPEEVRARLEAHDFVHIDLGTGDGKYILRLARDHPEHCCIGLDAVAANLVDTSGRALRKPSRGGAANALFVIAAVETLPPELRGTANKITINYPWGSLLEAVIVPNAAVLEGIVALARPGAEIEILLNLGIFEDEDYLDRLGLPNLDETDLVERLEPALAASGIHIARSAFLRGPTPLPTTWGKRLTLGSGRATLHLVGTIERGTS